MLSEAPRVRLSSASRRLYSAWPYYCGVAKVKIRVAINLCGSPVTSAAPVLLDRRFPQRRRERMEGARRRHGVLRNANRAEENSRNEFECTKKCDDARVCVAEQRGCPRADKESWGNDLEWAW